MMPENDLYGHKLAFAWYCGLSRPRTIFGTIPHGWAVDLERSSRRLAIAPLMLWNERHLTQAIEYNMRNVVCAGAPFGYLARTLWPDHNYPRGSGTLVFPQHGHETGRNASSIREMVSAVKGASPPPYTVAVAYDDWYLPSTQAWRDAGWRVITFGTRGGRPQFLVRVAFEIARHAAVVANQVQTALMYGALLGRDIRVVGPRVEWPEPHPNPANIKAAPSLWPALHESGLTGESATALGRFELGWSHNLPPKELADLLGWSSPPLLLASYALARVFDLRFGVKFRGGHLDPAEKDGRFNDVGRPGI